MEHKGYYAFARKYRPSVFGEVVGQGHITTTLENAIAMDRVAHAYVFAGPRGIGKTTTARILAKALNCEKGPRDGPCNKCSSCDEIAQGTNLDVMEIDGASNRGIDEIRNLRDNIKFAPTRGKYKIYIIDEVHMLTQEAFNALLKTLEEPPLHVRFIFATTSPHKIPATVLSRCQRFDFKRISTRDIIASLKRIAADEKLSVDEAVLALIARYADGSMRDAEVILDQITSFTKGKAALDDVVRMLGIVDEDMLFGLSASISEKDAVKALKLIDRIMGDGRDIFQVVTGLMEHFRNIAVAKVSGDLEELLDAGAERASRYKEEATKFSVEEVLYIIYTLANTMDFIRKSGMGRVPFEASLIKLTGMGRVTSLSDIVGRIEKLEVATSQPPPTALLRPSPSLAKIDAPRPAPAAPAAAPAPKTAPPAQPQAVKNTEIPAAMKKAGHVDEIAGSWNSILNYIKSRKMSIAQFLQSGHPVSLESGNVTIALPKAQSFNKEALDNQDSKQLIQSAIKDVTGLETKVKFVISETLPAPETPGPADPYGAAVEDDAPGMDDAPPVTAREVDPIIRDALEMFGGEIKDNGKGGSK